MDKIRYNKVDLLRGIAIVNMVLYHLLWDLVHMGNFKLDWYMSFRGYYWQQFICCSFIFISGFSCDFAKNKLKNGMKIFLLGLLISIITFLFMPQNVILFGILTLLGSCMIITYFLENALDKINIYFALALNLLLFTITKTITSGYINLIVLKLQLPTVLYRNLITAYFGFPYEGFFSTDYFPIIPWIFLFWTGYNFFKLLRKQSNISFMQKSVFYPLEYIGRKSLIIYLLHQVVIYAVLYSVGIIK